MAISGDIADLPLTDLLNMIRFRGGIVSLTDTPRVGEMVIYFSPGFVTGSIHVVDGGVTARAG